MESIDSDEEEVQVGTELVELVVHKYDSDARNVAALQDAEQER
jgi:hypothetical protein